MQRIANYGSFMQAWALRELLKSCGADVWFIDVKPGRTLPGYEASGLKVLWRRGLELMHAALTGKLGMKLRGRKFHRTMKARYVNEYYAMLGLGEAAPEHFDLAVIGSDQVFDCLGNNPWGFTTHLYGDVPEADKVVSYAASFGNASYDGLRKAGVTAEIAANLNKLAAISVRDDNSAKLVLKLTGRKAQTHLDPVLVYDFSNELEGRKTGMKDYIVVYAYPERITGREEIAAIKEFAKKRGKKLVSIMSTYDWCDRALIPDTPFDVLACFRDADYVVTDTFHGSIFSIVTGKKFCTLVRDSNSNKLGSLLGWLSLDERICAAPSDMEAILEREPDYAAVRTIIEREKQRTLDYLRSALE